MKFEDLATLQVTGTELAYVTSFDQNTKTFFSQLCKFTNEELIAHNLAINNHCLKLISANVNGPSRIAKGDILCAKYQADGEWYRALVLSRNKENQEYTMFFIDYGNIEIVPYDHLLQVMPEDLSEIQRCPFGFTCFLKDSENLTIEEEANLKKALISNYVMLKILEKQTKLQWVVDIPKHAYNLNFWNLFRPHQKIGGNPRRRLEDIEKEMKKIPLDEIESQAA